MAVQGRPGSAVSIFQVPGPLRTKHLDWDYPVRGAEQTLDPADGAGGLLLAQMAARSR
jgi:hypothetical protein